MKFEDLDTDTQGIIDAMCHNTGKTREQSILALVEFGMVTMIASVHPKRDKVVNVVFDAVNKDEKMKATAEAYKNFWVLNV